MLQPPLAGIRVLEVGNYMAGPYCGMQLADLGADVVKIEDPRGGDLSRRLEPMVDGESGNFVRINRSKRSVALDLKRDSAREVFRRLAARSDVIVENLRPGTMGDLGLDPRDLLDANPRLIYAAVTGWGLSGPYADRPALDIIVQAMSGLMSVTGEEGGAPVKVGVSISDLTAGLYATIAVLAALAVRARDGRGQLVDVSMFESSASLAVWEAGTYFTTGETPRAAGSAHKLLAPYQAVRAADGHFVVGATTPPNWTAFCRAMGLVSLEHDPRFADGTLRRARVAELIPLIEAVTTTRPAAHWLALLRDAGVPCAEIQDYAAVFTDPHLVDRGFFVDLPHPRLGTVRALGTPIRLASTRVGPERAGPLLGEHTREVLA
ncbi:MAG TPA: CoA transferase, partial [Candidatus Limnocylindria bacterium]|nr:CoA transferase [Candidatus Limnocylindria bacterium]